MNESICLFAGLTVLGQSNTSSAEIGSVLDFVVKGGPVMIPIGLCSLVALAVLVERSISLRSRKIIPPDFLPGLTAILESSRDRDKAMAYCTANASPIAAILAAGIRKLGAPLEVVEKRIVEAGLREIAKLRKYLRVLSVIGSVATLLGLLGTIFGMITAFQTVATSAEALGKTELLAKGIYEAMITTAAGLCLAIPVLLAYQWFSARIERFVLEMDQMSMDFVEKYAGSSTLAPPGAGTRIDAAAKAAKDNGSAMVETEAAVQSA